MAKNTRLQNFALRALRQVAREHIGNDFETDDTLCPEINPGHRRHNDQTVFHIVLSGACEISAEVTVHDKSGGSYRISILVLMYRRTNQETYHCPNSLFHTTISK